MTPPVLYIMAITLCNPNECTISFRDKIYYHMDDCTAQIVESMSAISAQLNTNISVKDVRCVLYVPITDPQL